MNIMQTIAQGVRGHTEFDAMGSSSVDIGYDIDRAQLAISILCSFLGEKATNELDNSATGAEQLRLFLILCGFSEEVAIKVVCFDTQPLAVY